MRPTAPPSGTSFETRLRRSSGRGGGAILSKLQRALAPRLERPSHSRQRNARRRAGGADALVGVSLEPLEIVAEHLHQPPRDLGEFALIAPGLDRIEDVRLDAWNLRRHGEAEMRIGAEIRPLQRTVE